LTGKIRESGRGLRGLRALQDASRLRGIRGHAPAFGLMRFPELVASEGSGKKMEDGKCGRDCGF
jgi:hypothetical protein